MFTSADLAVFVTASIVLVVTPGPAVLYIVARGIAGGPRAGFLSALGIGAGGALHVGAAVLGISTVLATSAAVFVAVKWAGAAYLIYLGIRTLLGRETSESHVSTEPVDHSFRRGIVVQVLNPKAAVFFLAFLPQFVDGTRGSAVVQVIVLGAIFVGIALVSDSMYGLASGLAGARLRRSARVDAVRRYVSGSLLVALGVGAAAAQGSS